MEDIFEVADINPSTALNKAKQNILVVNKEGKILFANAEAKGNIGEEGTDLPGSYLHKNLDYPSNEAEGFWGNSPMGSSIDGQVTEDLFWKRDGNEIPVNCRTSPLRNERGELIGAIISLDVESDKKKLKSELNHHQNHDRLTGLPNHYKFRDELENYLESNGSAGSGAVLLLDIDRFKEVNNSFGFGIADELLTTMAKLLKDKLSSSDTLARFGGDEFIVLSPDKNRKNAKELATNIVRAVRDQGFKRNGTSVQATVSVGYATFPDQGKTVDKLLAKADMALSRAKRSGRNQFKAYDPDQDSREDVKSRVEWVDQIDSAIKENNFVLYAQPILELGSDDISHYEILIRMTEGGGELVSPGRFLPVAEKFGLSRDIDKWVVNETLESLPETAREGLDNQFAINLSGQSLTDDELLDWLKYNQTLDSGNFERILFEVTETAALSNIQSANNFISALKSRGSKFALDDFGKGFSSFNYLKQLSVDYLKIDGSFIQNLPRDSMNQDLVQSMVEVAHKLQKETIAEFVEDEETLNLIRNYGSDHAQGYHIGRPQPLGNLV
ncbi:MAG: EAL domain-containing protein [Candidatus Bipolaricaulota bacterium]